MLTPRPSGGLRIEGYPGWRDDVTGAMDTLKIAAALSHERLGPYLCATGVNFAEVGDREFAR